MLTEDHKENQVTKVQAFLMLRKGDFLDWIVIDDETWKSHHTPDESDD